MLLDCVTYKDGVLLWNDNAPRHKGKPVGCPDYQGYIVFGFQGKQYKAHRIIWEIFNGPIPEGMMVDHIDRRPCNNNINNLRLATNTQNQSNSKSLGVRKKHNKWEARVSNEGNREHLGSFTCFGEAVKAVSKRKWGRVRYSEKDRTTEGRNAT